MLILERLKNSKRNIIGVTCIKNDYTLKVALKSLRQPYLAVPEQEPRTPQC